VKNKKTPNRKATEINTAELAKLLHNIDFKSENELKVFLDGIMNGGGIPEVPPKTALDKAQDIMYDAWESDNPNDRIKLAKKALKICPDCADAYNFLAEEKSETLKEAIDYYQKGVEAGRRALGEEMFKEDSGHFWGLIDTRPYMRSRFGLMECLWNLGKHDDAIMHDQEMLELNTSDNQGVRYILIAYFAEIGRYDQLDEFINHSEFKDDCCSEWHYTRALLSFVTEGESKKANTDLKIALKSNQYVPAYLTGKKRIPSILPDRITMGGEDEGFCYAYRHIKAWQKVPGAIEWLKNKS